MLSDILNDSALCSVGFADPARARTILESLADQGVTDDDVEALAPTLLTALRASPDPDRALNNLERWMSAVTSRYTQVQYLMRHPTAVGIFVQVCGVSQFFSDILVRHPEYFEILANPGVRGGSRSAGAVYRELSNSVDHIRSPQLKLEAMRGFKERVVLRIGARDILGLADMPATAREFSHLAEACVQKCAEIATGQFVERNGTALRTKLTVIAMGKLGGAELNYSSDIDLMFVCDDQPAEGDGTAHSDDAHVRDASWVAEWVVKALTQTTAAGHLFRVDMRLRPEGRFGSLVRTLSSYRAYYESWAETWEIQSLLKSRPVAGDTALGRSFMEMIRPYVYRRPFPAEMLADIRRNKYRIERKTAIEGQAQTNLKTGFGGIRDIEFLVQALQLQFAGRTPTLRTPNTLEAIARLRQAGVLTALQASDLSGDYMYLRTVEHRLQILADRQTQTLPVDPEERRLLARRLGYPGTAEFDSDFGMRTDRVRGHFLDLFVEAPQQGVSAPPDEWRGLLESIDSARSGAELTRRLAERGFADPNRGQSFLRSVLLGTDYGIEPTEAREALIDLGGRLIGACARTSNPDAALAGVQAVLQAAPNGAELLRAVAAGDQLLDRLCLLSAGSLPLAQSLARNMEWLDLLVSEEIVDPETKTVEAVRADLSARLPRKRGTATASDERFWDALAAFVRRERLRIGARDLWGEIGALQVGWELTALAEAVIGAILAQGAARVGERYSDPDSLAALSTSAVIGLGKLGGRELGYGSDWDVLLAYRGPGASGSLGASGANLSAGSEALNALGEFLVSAGSEMTTRGAPLEIDARLRPEGRFGPLARTVTEYAAHYSTEALTWERQVLTKARPVAGHMPTGRAYLRAAHQAIYSWRLGTASEEDVRSMKRRIEAERLKPGAQYTDIKLGHGGMSDIEFAAQMMQMRVGSARPQVRTSNTVEALRALAVVGVLPEPDAARLCDAYERWHAVRNRLALLGGLPTDVLPADERRLRAVAIGLGCTDTSSRSASESFVADCEERMREARSIVERVFYGET